MRRLSPQIAAGSRRGTLLRVGTVVADPETGALSVTTSGMEIPISAWVDSVRVGAGDRLLLALSESPDAQAATTVIGRLTATAPTGRGDEGTVTAVQPAARTVTVTINGATTPGVRYVGTEPAVGDVVLLDHRATVVYALGVVAPATPAATPPAVIAPPPPPPPAGDQTTGRVTLIATTSATWDRTNRVWNRYHGTGVMQGSWGAYSYSGHWWYGPAPTRLAGRTPTRVTLDLGPVKRAGAYGSARTVHLWRHTAANRGATEPTRSGTAIDLALPAGATRLAVTSDEYPALLDLAAGLAGGGGLSIVGDPYLGFEGVTAPNSGKLTIDWKAA